MGVLLYGVLAEAFVKLEGGVELGQSSSCNFEERRMLNEMIKINQNLSIYILQVFGDADVDAGKEDETECHSCLEEDTTVSHGGVTR